MRRVSLLVLAWLAGTAAAGGVALAAVRLVTQQVVAPLPPAMIEATGGPLARPAPTSTATVPADPSRTPATTPSPPVVLPATPGATTPPPQPTRSPSPSPSPSGTARTELRTYQLKGGTVTIGFSPDAVRVVQAEPNAGFTREVETEGPLEVKVVFESEQHRSRLDAWWADGPQREIREEPHD